MVILAELYRDGRGVNQSMEMAERYLVRARDTGVRLSEEQINSIWGANHPVFSIASFMQSVPGRTLRGVADTFPRLPRVVERTRDRILEDMPNAVAQVVTGGVQGLLQNTIQALPLGGLGGHA